MNAGNLFPLVRRSKREGKLADPLRLHFGNDLERLDDAGNGLMFQAGIFTFGILSDDTHVDTRVTGDVARHILD